jgi:hypothetical protein
LTIDRFAKKDAMIIEYTRQIKSILGIVDQDGHALEDISRKQHIELLNIIGW